MREQSIFLPVIAGPTAAGKTALSVALAKVLDGEVISADSMQIYQSLSIGTARPTEAEQEGVPHHLLGFCPLSTPYSVAQYVEDAHRVIRDVVRRGKQPILCGGTGLYIRSLIENITFSGEAPADTAYRDRLRRLAEEQGGEVLREQLRQVDPETAERLHPNDTGRLIRALELYCVSGLTVSEHNRRSRAVPSPYRACVILLTTRDRAALYERIDRRVDAMMAAGLLEEARVILATPEAPTAMQAIGYKELLPYFRGEITQEEAVARIKQGTRRYAKRQLSWFRQMNTHPLYREDYGDGEALCRAALAVLRQEKAGAEYE